jgi:hypothetical protein
MSHGLVRALQSGVRTPLAGILTGIIVLLAIYFITPAFYCACMRACVPVAHATGRKACLAFGRPPFTLG